MTSQSGKSDFLQEPEASTIGHIHPGRGMGGHQSAARKTDEWYTPPSIFAALSIDFDLDPASPGAAVVPWVPAARCFTQTDNGLVQPWQGRVWLNPPYGDETRKWLSKLAAHGDGIALVFARTDTAWAQDAIVRSSAICLIAGRLHFIRSDGRPANANAGAPSMLPRLRRRVRAGTRAVWARSRVRRS